MLKIRGGADTYVKQDGKIGTADKGALVLEDVSFTVAAAQDQTMFQPVPMVAETTPKVGNPGDAAYTLRSREKGGGINDACVMPEERGYVVRRLMPVETERLQAFPDNWTDITGCDVDAVTERVAKALKYERDSKEYKALRRKVEKWSDGTPDTPRYKAMGNSMTTYVIEIIGRRIQAYDELHYDEVGL